jgi:nitrite reductase (NO-forming)
MVAEHIANGMYGMILVEPAAGLPAVDREFYVMLGEIYTKGAFGEKGAQQPDTRKLLDERPDYFVLNGAVGALTERKPMHAKTGETVRLYFGDGGPNAISSLHLIGEVFDRLYTLGTLSAPPLTDVQTALVPPGGAVIAEVALLVPGKFILVDHVLSRMQRGLSGWLVVEGAARPDLYDGVMRPGSGH